MDAGSLHSPNTDANVTAAVDDAKCRAVKSLPKVRIYVALMGVGHDANTKAVNVAPNTTGSAVDMVVDGNARVPDVANTPAGVANVLSTVEANG